MSKNDSLERFVNAQREDYENALSEIKKGRKQSHWMWYIFPQIKGLGFSETSKFFGINHLGEAEEYLKHPILGTRLVAICNELLKLKTNNANSIFGTPDDLKLRSSMTLFSSVKGSDPVFNFVLEKFFNGAKDNKTLELINNSH